MSPANPSKQQLSLFIHFPAIHSIPSCALCMRSGLPYRVSDGATQPRQNHNSSGLHKKKQNSCSILAIWFVFGFFLHQHARRLLLLLRSFLFLLLLLLIHPDDFLGRTKGANTPEKRWHIRRHIRRWQCRRIHHERQRQSTAPNIIKMEEGQMTDNSVLQLEQHRQHKKTAVVTHKGRYCNRLKNERQSTMPTCNSIRRAASFSSAFVWLPIATFRPSKRVLTAGMTSLTVLSTRTPPINRKHLRVSGTPSSVSSTRSCSFFSLCSVIVFDSMLSMIADTCLYSCTK